MAKHPNLFFHKTGDVKSPGKAHATDAGFDFYVPNDVNPIVLHSLERAAINLKTKVHFSEGYALIFHDKSGVALKKNLKVCGGVVDSEYTGEVILNIVNIGLTPQTIMPGEKIAQAILMPISLGEAVELSEEDYSTRTRTSTRGEGGHGSTGAF